MNQAIIGEIAFSLRRLEFPMNVKECLSQINNLYFSLKSYGWNPEQLADLISQFIYSVKVNDVKRSRLSSSQKLELAEMLLTYLSSVPGSDTDRLAVFSTIFPTSQVFAGDTPLVVLSLVTSLAIALRNPEVLKTIAVWMMQSGLESAPVLYIAGDVTKDFTSDENPEKYSTLPQVSFPFASVLLIAIGKTYQNTSPPPRLITQVTTWINKYPNVVFFVPHSSIFEIFRWVVNSGNQSELFLELLKAIRIAGERVQHQLQVIPQVMTLIHEISVKIAKLGLTSGVNNLVIAEQCTDRLFQLIQVLISVGCLDGNEINPIFEAAHHARLPNTHLYDMMKRMYVK